MPYPYRPGMWMNLQNGNSAIPSNSIPGIMSMDWVPTFGASNTSTDPASIAGKEFYGRVRASFSGSIDADAPDFMVYVGALDSLFAYIGWLKRVYRTLTTYSPDNFMLPDGLMAAYGFSSAGAEQLRADKVRFWQGINELILKSRKFRCPAVMDIFNRHYWMSDNVYADAPSVRAQMYVFNLVGVFKVAKVAVSGSTDQVEGLVMNQIPTWNDTQISVGNEHIVCDGLIQFGDGLIQALDAWDDAYLISGYLSRAFEGVSSFVVAELLQDEELTAQYVPEVLAQIENSRTVMLPGTNLTQVDFGKWIVTQDPLTNAVVSKSTLVYKSGIESGKYVASLLPNGINPMLSMRSENPTVADTVIASRLHAYSKHVTNTSGVVTSTQVTCGTEIPLMWKLTDIARLGDFPWKWTKSVPYVSLFNLDSKETANTKYNQIDNSAFFIMPQFDWHPFFNVLYNPGPDNNNNQLLNLYACGDTFNPTVFTPEQLENIHKVCVYSEFNSFSIQ